MHKLLKQVCAVAMAAVMMLSVPSIAFANQPEPQPSEVNIASDILTPVRDFFETEGAQVEWYGPLSQITVTLNGHEARFFLGNYTVYVNNVPRLQLLSPVYLSDDVAFMYLGDIYHILSLLQTPALVIQTPAVSRIPTTYAHGAIAYRHLEFIEENLPGRIAFTQRERDTAEWIAQELMDMGHDPANISMQEFPINDLMLGIVIALNILDEPVEYIPEWLQPVLASLNIYSMDDILEMEFVGYSQNVILTVPGVSDRRIIVGAHYDSPNSPGISDNASGVVVLLESAERILELEHYYTITYIFFGAEEVGLVGALYYVNALTPEELNNIALMINVDVIFDGTTLTYGVGYHCFETRSEGSSHISETIEDVANALNEEFDFELVRQPTGIYVSSDQLAFLFAGIDILVFYSMDGAYAFPPLMAKAALGILPQLTPAMLELMAAMLDGDSEADILAEIDRYRDVLEFLLFMGVASLDVEFMHYQLNMVEMLMDTIDDYAMLEALYIDLLMLTGVIAVLEHPEFENFMIEAAERTAQEVGYGALTGGMGLVLHTLNDNLAYLNENWPGLIEAALEAYLLFLERILTLPAGSLD